MLSGRGLCDGLITRPEESHRVRPTECGVSKCDRVASIMRKPWPSRGCHNMGNVPMVESDLSPQGY